MIKVPCETLYVNISLLPPRIPVRSVLLLYPLYFWGGCVISPKQVGLWTQVVWLQPSLSITGYCVSTKGAPGVPPGVLVLADLGESRKNVKPSLLTVGEPRQNAIPTSHTTDSRQTSLQHGAEFPSLPPSFPKNRCSLKTKKPESFSDLKHLTTINTWEGREKFYV